MHKTNSILNLLGHNCDEQISKWKMKHAIGGLSITSIWRYWTTIFILIYFNSKEYLKINNGINT